MPCRNSGRHRQRKILLAEGNGVFGTVIWVERPGCSREADMCDSAQKMSPLPILKEALRLKPDADSSPEPSGARDARCDRPEKKQAAGVTA